MFPPQVHRGGSLPEGGLLIPPLAELWRRAAVHRLRDDPARPPPTGPAGHGQCWVSSGPTASYWTCRPRSVLGQKCPDRLRLDLQATVSVGSAVARPPPSGPAGHGQCSVSSGPTTDRTCRPRSVFGQQWPDRLPLDLQATVSVRSGVTRLPPTGPAGHGQCSVSSGPTASHWTFRPRSVLGQQCPDRLPLDLQGTVSVRSAVARPPPTGPAGHGQCWVSSGSAASHRTWWPRSVLGQQWPDHLPLDLVATVSVVAGDQQRPSIVYGVCP